MSNPNVDLGFDLDALLGNKKSKTNYKYLEEGIAVYKILPPSPTSSNRSLNSEHNFHWVMDASGKKIKVQCTYYTEKYCPLCNAHKNAEEAYNQALKMDPNSENTKRLKESAFSLQKSKTICYAAVTLNGEVVVLQLTKTVSDLLVKKIAEAYEKRSIDATNMSNGLWFEFNKQGKGRDSVSVDFNRFQKEIDGETVDVLNRNPVPKEISENLAEKIPDIHSKKIMWIQEYSGAELSDYLKGTPLKSKITPRTGNSTTPEPVKPVMQASEPSTSTASSPSSSGGAASDFAAEAARLRALAQGNK